MVSSFAIHSSGMEVCLRSSLTNIAFLMSNFLILVRSSRANSSSIVEQVLSPESVDHVFAVLKPLHLPLDGYREMIAELVSIIDNYAYLSEHPVNRHLPDLEE